jgi:hypothetical protein
VTSIRNLAMLAVLACVLLFSSSALAANNPVPLVYQPLVPAAVAPGAPAFTLTVNGTGFVSGATIQWNGSSRTTTFVNSTQLTAAILASDVATAGTAKITVLNPAPGGGTSNIVLFQVTTPTTGVTFSSSTVTMALPPLWISAYDMFGQPIAADLNGDGKADLVVLSSTNNNGVINVRLGNGDGTFQPIVQYPYNVPGNAGAVGLVAADFNGDGKLDIAVTFANAVTPPNQPTNTTAVLLGNGDGTFRAPVSSSQSMGGTAIFRPQAADVNGDGKLDIVGICGAGNGPGAICVLLGNGDGTFTAGFTSQGFARGRYAGATTIAIGDFNADGKLDLVASIDPEYLILLLGNGDGTFGAPSIIFNSYARYPGGVVAADFNGDGKLDLAYYHDECANQGSGPCSGNLDFLLGNGNGTFQPPLTLTSLPDPQSQLPPILGDFNGDGKIDLAFGTNLLLLGTGSGPLSYSLLSIPTDIRQQNVASDFTGNGRLGLTGIQVPNSGQGSPTDVNLLLQASPNPDFTWSASSPYQTVVTGATATYTITVSAVDGFNGALQFGAAGLPAGAVATFTPSTVIGSGSTTLSISTSSSTPTGSYATTVTATSGSLSKSGGLTLNVGPAGTDFTDFAGSITPTYENVTPGGSAGYGIQIQPLNGFTENVSLSVSGLPTGATAAFNPPTINGGSGTSTLTVVSAASTPTGSYPFTLTATSGSKIHSTTLTLNVGPAGSNFGDFTGTMTPTSQTVKAGTSTAVTISLQPVNGYTGNAWLTLDSLPSGSAVGASGNQNIPVPGSTTITITTSTSTPPGTYMLLFRATGSNSFGSVSHSAAFTLTVTP